MHVILADDIDGGIFALLMLGGVLVTSVFALIGLVPALRGEKTVTLCLITPAILCGLAMTVWLVWQFIEVKWDDTHFRFERGDMVVFIIFIGPPFITSLITALVLRAKRRKMRATVLPKI